MPSVGRVLHHLVRADSGIHADDQLHAQRGGVLHRFALHAVAVANPVRDETSGDRARQIEYFLQAPPARWCRRRRNRHRAESVPCVRWPALAAPLPLAMSASRNGSCRSAGDGGRNRRAAAGSANPRAHKTRAAGSETPRAADNAAAWAGSTSAKIHFIHVFYCYIRGCNLRVGGGHQNKCT